MFAGSAAEKFRSDLKQADAAGTAGNVFAGAEQQVRQQRRTHLVQFGSYRVGQFYRFAGLAEEARQFGIGKAPGYGFKHSARSQFVFNRYRTALSRVQGLLRKFVGRHRQRRNIVQPGHANHFFNQIGLAFDIAAPGRGNGFQTTVFPADFKAERGQNSDNFVFRDIQSGQGFHPLRPQAYRRRFIVFLTADRNFRSLTAADVQNQRRGIIRPHNVGIGIDPALVAITGIGLNLKMTAGAGNAAGFEIGAFQQHVDGIFAAAFGRAAHHAAQTLHAFIVADAEASVVQRIFFSLKRNEFFSFFGHSDGQGTF